MSEYGKCSQCGKRTTDVRTPSTAGSEYYCEACGWLPHFDYLGSVSTGTMRNEDLIPAFLAVLQDLNPSQAAQLTSGDDPDDLAVLESLNIDGSGDIPDSLLEHASEMVTWLFDELESCAPAGYYFGAIEGDGSDYGFWSLEA